MLKRLVFAVTLLGLMAPFAFAQFQLIYTQESALAQDQELPLRVVFTRPFTNDLVMDMGLEEDGLILDVEEFYVLHKENSMDIKDTLEEITFEGSENSGSGYASSYHTKGVGDYIFVLKPSAYYVEETNSYIQQITKMIVNVAGVSTDWDAELGLEAEIVPLTKPYSIWKGGTFSAIVKREGRAVPFAEVEVEYLNYDISLDENKTIGEAKVVAPHSTFTSMSVKADSNGKFTIGLPKSGWWGIKARSIGSKTKFNEKNLSQDALIWVQVRDMD